MNRSELGGIVTDCLVAMVTALTGMVPPKGEAIPNAIQGPIDRAADRIFAAMERKPSLELAFNEWVDKSQWARKGAKAEELGMHLADVIRQRFDRLLAERDQLQTDLTARDEKLDQTQDLLRCMVYDYRSVVQAGYDRITALGSDCDSVTKMLADNPNYQKALALLLPDLESRPEERGTPEAEPCSGCGSPGWTGACNKCVPY